MNEIKLFLVFFRFCFSFILSVTIGYNTPLYTQSQYGELMNTWYIYLFNKVYNIVRVHIDVIVEKTLCIHFFDLQDKPVQKNVKFHYLADCAVCKFFRPLKISLQ